jgi:hypothetical protein
MLYFSILIGQTKYILKDPMDDFMSLKIKIIFKPKFKNMSINELFLKTIKILLKKNQDSSSWIKRKTIKIFLLKVVKSLQRLSFLSRYNDSQTVITIHVENSLFICFRRSILK